MLPKVSAVIPSYNHKKYISKAIESVMKQDYQNLELVVIDDGSSDGSPELLRKLAERYEFILVLQNNTGVCKALNRAIKESSTGDFIAILDSDDYWHPEKITKQVSELLKNKEASEFCFTKATEFDPETGNVIRVFPNKDFSGSVLNKIYIRQPYAFGSVIFSRDLFNKVQGFDEKLVINDWDFSIRCSAFTEFSYIKEPLYFYRSHPENTMKKLGRKKIFNQKVQLLRKNRFLAPWYIWTLSLAIHFVYDYYLIKLKFLDFRKIIN